MKYLFKTHGTVSLENKEAIKAKAKFHENLWNI